MKKSETEKILKNAVIEMHRRELGLIPEKAELRASYVPLSKGFYDKIRQLLKRMRRRYQIELWTNVAAAILVVIVTVFLFTTPGTLTKARDKIVEVFERYFKITFEESDEKILVVVEPVSDDNFVSQRIML